jgi:hypothetical protein
MLRWVRSWFAWNRVFVAGVWLYEQNTVTGRRRASRIDSSGYSPINFDWLDAGSRHPQSTIAPLGARPRRANGRLLLMAEKSITWNGAGITARMRAAQVAGVNRTMGRR